MSSTRFSRRSFVKGAAVGATALAAAGRIAAPGDVAAADSVSLEFWSPANDPVGEGIITKLVNGFNSTVGKQQGITANLRIKPATGSNYVQYTTAMTSSGSPDVVMTYDYSPVSGWAANGFIQPLDQYAEAAGIKQSDFFPIAWQMTNFAGHTWGLLQEFDFNQFWWNKGVYTGDPPKTFDELDALAAKYTKFDSSGKLSQAGLIPWIHSTGGAIAGSALDWNVLWGGSFYDYTNAKWTINTPANQKFLQWMLKYVDLLGGRGKSDAFESAIPSSYGDIFQYGKVVFSLEGEYLPQELKKQGLNLQYGIAHPPTAPEITYGTAQAGGGNLFLLPTKSKHPKEAATFIQYMGTGAQVLGWCIPNSNIPPTKAAAFDPSFQQQLPELKPWIDSLQTGHMVPPVPSPQYNLFYQTMITAVDEVTYKKKTPAQALADVESKVMDAVHQFQQVHPDWKGE